MERLLAAVLAVADVGIVVFDERGRFVMANLSFRDLFRWCVGGLHSKTFASLFPDAQLPSSMNQLAHSVSAGRYQTRIRAGDGTLVGVEVHARWITHEDEDSFWVVALTPLGKTGVSVGSELQSADDGPPVSGAAGFGRAVLERIRNSVLGPHVLAGQIEVTNLDPIQQAAGGHRPQVATHILAESEAILARSLTAADVFTHDGTRVFTVCTLLKNADIAMYAAKAAGRHTAHCFSPAMAEALEQRFALELALRGAIGRAELTLVYQPKTCLATGEVRGVEALLRWKHPQRGWIAPTTFIPVAEETGLIEPIGAWVLEEICRVIAGWDAQRFGPLHVAVNVAAAQINHGDPASLLADLTRRYRIDPGRIEIEVTETAVLADAERAAAKLNRLRSLGVTVALDDFGTGYSSLLYLRQLDIDTIKIDRSFLNNAPPRSRNAEIVRLIIRLAKTLDLAVVAEGVETVEQAALLREAGCDLIQGYLVAQPMPLADLQNWLAAHHAAIPRPSQPGVAKTTGVAAAD